jgi:hypothetical protein
MVSESQHTGRGTGARTGVLPANMLRLLGLESRFFSVVVLLPKRVPSCMGHTYIL